MDTRSSDDVTGRPAEGHTRFEAALAHRMEQLEFDNRRLRRLTTMMGVGMAIVLGLLAAVLAFSARYGLPGSTASEVAAKQFTLRDGDGRVRGIWGTSDEGRVSLVLQDGGGKQRVKLNLLPDGSTGLAFADSAGHSRAVFALMPDESAQLVFGDRLGTSRSVLGVAPDGSGTLVFADKRGNTRASVGVDSRGLGTLTVLDRSGQAAPPEEPAEEPQPADTQTVSTSAAATPPAAEAKRK
jgi:hypothetical protein